MDSYVIRGESVIDPEVRAFVFSLISALGGSSAGDDGRYVLGDDALAVLKDIKRWLRLYDDKTNRLDVARLLAEGNLVVGDLLEILASWPEDAAEGSFKSKVSLLCVDLLTQLTWPIEKDEENSRLDHFYHIPYLRAAQVNYKRAILHHDTTLILRTIVRVALPALAKSRNDRSPWEDNVIKVVLYLFRNIALISPSGSQKGAEHVQDTDGEVSRSNTIEAFHKQDIFHLILMICSSMTEDYATHDIEVLDILFHILKGIDADKLMMNRDALSSTYTQELQDLIAKEKGMIAGYSRNAPSRHNRWGNMLWVKRDEGRFSTVFGQNHGTSEQSTMNALDQSKKWKPPRRPKKDISENSQMNFDNSVPLTGSARNHLRNFVEQFLDSSFNPLFTAVRRAIEREADRVLETHSQQYFYLVSWFLRAESARRTHQAQEQRKSGVTTELESYALVASVLNQETFVLLGRSLQKSGDNKHWQPIKSEMKCFTQILLTIQDMSDSPLEEDQEIAENILSRIFYEQTTHDRIILLLKTYKDQGFGYLDACTELAHVFLRLLERYSKQNVDMQVRSIRRARKKKEIQPESAGAQDSNEANREVDAGDVEEAQRISVERKFDFTRFVAKFISQSSVDTFLAFVRHYKDLNNEQLKRAHRFFYRVAFKMDMTMYLFRMDIVLFFQKLIKSPEGLAPTSPYFKEWEELIRQVFRRLVKRLEDRPAMAIELLFTKMSTTMFYLEHGFDREVPKKMQRAPIELEIKPGMSKHEEIGVAVSALINQSKFDGLWWVKKLLSSGIDERKSWEGEAEARKNLTAAHGISLENEESRMSVSAGQSSPEDLSTEEVPAHDFIETAQAPAIAIKTDKPEEDKLMLKDKHVRLLLSVIGIACTSPGEFGEDGTLQEGWYIPGSQKAADLEDARTLIESFEFQPPTYQDGEKRAEDYIRRKIFTEARSTTTRTTSNQNSYESEGESGLSDLEQLFPAGGPTARPSSRSPSSRKTQRRRKGHAKDELLDDKGLEERREAKRKLELEKLRKIKSELYVRESDDESDDERDRAFFQSEEQLRLETQDVLKTALERAAVSENDHSKKRKGARSRSENSRKRKTMSEDENSNESDVPSGDEEVARQSIKKKRMSNTRLSALLDKDSASSSESDGTSDDNTTTATARRHRNQIKKPKRTVPRKVLNRHNELESGSLSSGSNGSNGNESEADTDTDAATTVTLASSQQPPISGQMQPSKSEDEVVGLSRRMDVDVDEDAESRIVGSDSDKENAGGVRPPNGLKDAAKSKPDSSLTTNGRQRRSVRAGFIIDSDSDDSDGSGDDG